MIFPGGTWVATSLGWTVVLAAVAAATLEEPRSTTVFEKKFCHHVVFRISKRALDIEH